MRLTQGLNRRKACQLLMGGLSGVCSGLSSGGLQANAKFRLTYILASSLYGEIRLEEIVPEVHKTGAEHIDIWPLGHANQREQMEEMGHDQFAELLAEHEVKLGILTHYDLGPYRLQEEMKVAQKLGAKILICGSDRLSSEGDKSLKQKVKDFLERMKPHAEAAARAGVIIGIENHGNSLISSPDSIRYFGELAESEQLGIALAPYHLPQDPELIAGLIKELGSKLVHFYAWQHGKGAVRKLPKKEEMFQMPGYGSMDFVRIVAALREIDYPGWTSIFMHPVPRGIPILPEGQQVTEAVNKSRRYLETCLGGAA